MPYVDLAGLSRFASRQKDQLEREYALLRDMQWLRTEKAGAVACWPVGGTQLKPVVDYIFTEVPPASGDKGPSNPSTITGVSSVGVRQLGANLAFSATTYRFSHLGDMFYGGTIDNSSGSVNLSCRVTYLAGVDISFIDREKDYCCVVEYQNCDAFDIGGTKDNPLFTISGGSVSVSGTGVQKIDLVVRDTSNPAYLLRAAKNVAIGTSETFKFRIAILQCSASEVDLDTYKYDDANILYTLDLGSTYYGGSIDLATGVMTVTHEVVQFDGTEGIQKDGTYNFYYTTHRNPAIKSTLGFTATHFLAQSSGADSMTSFTNSSGTTFGWTVATSASWATVDDLQAWLVGQYAAGTPLVVCYELATPFTVQLTPVQISALAQADKYTPRLNTIYSDQQTVQINYIKSPIREEYELTQAIVAQGGNV